MEANYIKIGSEGNNTWLINSVMSCLLFAIGSFLIGLNSLNPYLGKLLVSCGYLIAGLLWVLYFFLFRKDLLSFKVEPGLISTILSGVFNHFGNFCLILGFTYDPLNQGIISIMVIGVAIISAILSFYIYNEKLGVPDIIGMTICTSGLVTIGIYSNGSSQNSIIGFSFGLSAMVFYAIRTLLCRQAERLGINFLKSSVISVFSEALTGFLNIAIIWIFVDVFSDTQQFWITLVGGIFYGIGSLFLSLAVMAGKIGPSNAIACTMGVLQMVLDYLFRDITPETGKMVGGIIAIFGVMVLLLWKDIIRKNN